LLGSQSSSYLNSKYLWFVSRQGASLDTGTDVTFLYSKQGPNNRQPPDHRHRHCKRVTKTSPATPSTYSDTLLPLGHTPPSAFNASISSLILYFKSSSAFRGPRLAPQESCVAAAVTSTDERNWLCWRKGTGRVKRDVIACLPADVYERSNAVTMLKDNG
jgi:hypothetical protein